MPNILALDQGTTGSTALIFDGAGKVIGRGYQEIPQSLPARARPVTDREHKLLVAAREQMRKRYDSTLVRVPPKARPRMAAIFEGALSRMVPPEVPAYLPYGMVTLSRNIVALARGEVVRGAPSVLDWVDISNGRHGSFELPAIYRILGAGMNRVVFGRVGPDGFVEVCSLPLELVMRSSRDWQ